MVISKIVFGDFVVDGRCNCCAKIIIFLSSRHIDPQSPKNYLQKFIFCPNDILIWTYSCFRNAKYWELSGGMYNSIIHTGADKAITDQ